MLIWSRLGIITTDSLRLFMRMTNGGLCRPVDQADKVTQARDKRFLMPGFDVPSELPHAFKFGASPPIFTAAPLSFFHLPVCMTPQDDLTTLSHLPSEYHTEAPGDQTQLPRATIP